MTRQSGAVAANRFGLGARPGEIAAAAGDPRGWLAAQIREGAAVIRDEGLAKGAERFTAYAAKFEELRRAGSGAGANPEQAREIQQMVQRDLREGLMLESAARARFATETAAPFAERWARFWANHFTVAARNAQLIGVVGPYEREAIRPHVFGSFRDLLRQATFHPGMLIYLDAFRSVGPASPVGRRREAGLNENLAREILELHTVGVHGGYTQDDVIEFAKALTGWTLNVRNPRPGVKADAVFQPVLHEPGARTLMGRTYRESGREQAVEILDDLARHPATARHVALKLARHFVADAPPDAAVGRLETAFLSSGGDLGELARAVIALDEAWAPEPRKFKTPEELLVSAARAVGAEAAYGRDERALYESLAQRPYGAPSPAGWPDDAAAWSGPDAVMKRLEWANLVARRLSRDLTAAAFLDAALGPLASERTRTAASRAESAEQALTLALMSPEFQRR